MKLTITSMWAPACWFNFLPAELVGERFFFSWQLVTPTFRF